MQMTDEDIVCAAVSALVINTIKLRWNVYRRTTSRRNADEDRRDSLCDFLHRTGSSMPELLMQSLVLGLQGIQNELWSMIISFLNFREV